MRAVHLSDLLGARGNPGDHQCMIPLGVLTDVTG